ncbi:MAG: hypothetical protein KJ645_02445 [Planctomycetes bacterium]|nr:hypothetical protein [Planctomycetota bacterium]
MGDAKNNRSSLYAFLVPFSLIVFSIFLVTQDEARADEDDWIRWGSDPDYLYHIDPLEIGSSDVEVLRYQLPDPAKPIAGLAVIWHGMRKRIPEGLYWPYSWEEYIKPTIDEPFDDADALTDFCYNNGLIVLSPLCKSTTHFGHVEAQKYCTAAISGLKYYLLHNYPAGSNSFDNNKIYMVGFSMGANAALSYACRHLKFAGEDYPDPNSDEGYPVAGLILNAGCYDPANIIADPEWRDGSTYYSLTYWEHTADPGKPKSWTPTNWYVTDHPLNPYGEWEPLWNGLGHTADPNHYPLLDPAPGNEYPNLFYYQQISTLILEGFYDDENYPGCYSTHDDISIARNLLSKTPVYIVYNIHDHTGGGKKPTNQGEPGEPGGVPKQNDRLINMLSSFGGRIRLGSYVDDRDWWLSPSPTTGNDQNHTWYILCQVENDVLGMAFTHLGFGTDGNGRPLHHITVDDTCVADPYQHYKLDLLADRCWYKPNNWNTTGDDGRFYWVDILKQETEPIVVEEYEPTPAERIFIDHETGIGDAHQLSHVVGSVNCFTNTLTIENAYNIKELGVNCDWGVSPWQPMLHSNRYLKINYHASCENKLPDEPDFGPQNLYLVSEDTLEKKPAYTVYNSGENRGKIFWPPENVFEFWKWWDKDFTTMIPPIYQGVNQRGLRFLLPGPVDNSIDVSLKVSFEDYVLDLKLKNEGGTQEITQVTVGTKYRVIITGFEPEEDEIYLFHTFQDEQIENAFANTYPRQNFLINLSSGNWVECSADENGVLDRTYTAPALQYGHTFEIHCFQVYRKINGSTQYKISNLKGLKVVE